MKKRIRKASGFFPVWFEVVCGIMNGFFVLVKKSTRNETREMQISAFGFGIFQNLKIPSLKGTFAKSWL